MSKRIWIAGMLGAVIGYFARWGQERSKQKLSQVALDETGQILHGAMPARAYEPGTTATKTTAGQKAGRPALATPAPKAEGGQPEAAAPKAVARTLGSKTEQPVCLGLGLKPDQWAKQGTKTGEHLTPRQLQTLIEDAEVYRLLTTTEAASLRQHTTGPNNIVYVQVNLDNVLPINLSRLALLRLVKKSNIGGRVEVALPTATQNLDGFGYA